MVRCPSEKEFSQWKLALQSQTADNTKSTYIRPVIRSPPHDKRVSYFLNLFNIRGLIDIVVVLPMSTSWTSMLVHAGSILSCTSMHLGCLVPVD